NDLGGTVADGFAFRYLQSTLANPVLVSGNNSNSNTGDGFFFWRTVADADSTFTAQNNNANSNGWSGFHVMERPGLTIDGSTGSSNGSANSNKRTGVFIESSSNITVMDYNTNSTTTTNGIAYSGNGVYVLDSTGVMINDVIARMNARNGFLFENSS